MKKLPQVIITLKESETKEVITDQSVFVSVLQDKFLEGFKEIARSRPSPIDGTVRYEAASLTKYRIVGDGPAYDSNEKIIDTGFNFAIPINEILYLKQKFIPTPDLDFGYYTRDVGLAQIMPLIVIVIGIAVILSAIAYTVSKVGFALPKRRKQEAK